MQDILASLYDLILDILSVPAVTLTIVAFLGLLALRKTWSEVANGTLRTFIAITILVAGATTVVNALAPLNDLLSTAFGFHGVYTLEEVTTAAALPYLGTEIGGIFGLGFLLHVLIVRLLPFTSIKGLYFKQIYLTGHVMWTMSGSLALLNFNFGFTGTEAIVIGGIMLAIYLTVSPAIIWPFIKKITDGKWGFGHIQSVGIFISGWVARLLGNKENDAEKLSIPESLAFIKQPAIISLLIMLFIYLLPTLWLGPEYISANYSGTQNYVVWAVIQAVTFAAGVEIILTGVRMFLGEIIPAFDGIRQKLIPGALPALDCPTIYPYGPVSLMLGVLFHVIFTILATFIQIATASPIVVLPNAIYMFFVGASTGIVANREGGIRGILIASIVSSFYYMYLPILYLPFLGLDKLGLTGLSMSADNAMVGLIYGVLLSLFTGQPP
ncbi:MAG: PTS transporter subunit IIC [Candidatus Asgardarchaeia archaeon]